MAYEGYEIMRRYTKMLIKKDVKGRLLKDPIKVIRIEEGSFVTYLEEAEINKLNTFILEQHYADCFVETDYDPETDMIADRVENDI